MLILDWIKPNVVSITPEATLLKCRKLFKEHQIHRLPVVDADGIVVGILSITDLQSYMPVHATPLEIIEALDLLENTKAKQIMTVNPVTISYKSTVDRAAQIMTEKRVTCLPVVDDDEKLLGILTEWDVFKALVDITGVAQDGVDMDFVLENKRGTLRELLDQLREEGMRIISVLSSFQADGKRQVKLRFHSEDAAAERRALEKLQAHPGLRYWARGGEVTLK